MIFVSSLSHTEEIVGEYLKYLKDKKGRLKYIISERVKVPTKKGGHSDIDILAVGDKDVLIIQTKQYMWSGSKKESLKKIIDNLRISENFVRKQYYRKNRQIIKILCYEYGSKTLVKELERKDVKTIELQWPMINFLCRLGERMYGAKDWWKKDSKSCKWEGRGKEENNLVRTLIFLIEWELVDKNVLKEYNSDAVKELKRVKMI